MTLFLLLILSVALITSVGTILAALSSKGAERVNLKYFTRLLIANVLLYAIYESAIYPHANIRVDLLIILPALVFQALSILMWLALRQKQPSGSHR